MWTLYKQSLKFFGIVKLVKIYRVSYIQDSKLLHIIYHYTKISLLLLYNLGGITPLAFAHHYRLVVTPITDSRLRRLFDNNNKIYGKNFSIIDKYNMYIFIYL